MYPGKTIKMENKDYIIPPISLGQLRNGGMDLIKEHDIISEALAKGDISKGTYFDMIDARAKVVAMAFKRNYPDEAESIVLNGLDAINVNELWLYVMGLAAAVKPGETAPGA